MRPRVAVIGGGVSGLAAAIRLLKLDPSVEVLLLEAASRLGGVLQTTQRDGFLIEHAADGFLANVPWGVDFARRVGCELVATNAGHQRAFVVHRGKLQPIPPGFLVMAPSRLGPLLTSPVLSVRGKLRLALECLVPPRRDNEDESLAAFARRRLGREAYERLVQPLVGGIYTGDPERLSLEATMPRFKIMERKHGSLWRAMRREPRGTSTASSSGARYSQFVAPREGMSGFVLGAARLLPPQAIRPDTRVAAADPLPSGGWRLQVQGGCPGLLTVDGLILAAPAFEAARLLSRIAPTAAEDLRQVEYSSCALVSVGYRREQIAHPLDGFGFVVPRDEDRLILSGSFASLKYPGRAPRGTVLVRVFIGGALQGHLLGLTDDDLVELARLELSDLLAIRGEPLLTHVSRRHHSMPQHYVGHAERARRIHGALDRFPTLALAGGGLCGVGIPNCIHSGEEAASRILPHVLCRQSLKAAV